jgi:hypothetical protein
MRQNTLDSGRRSDRTVTFTLRLEADIPNVRIGAPTYPRPKPLPHNPLAHHPNGAAVRRYAGGWVRVGACGRVLRPAPGRFWEPPWGHYGPCARSIARACGRPRPLRSKACDEAMSRTGSVRSPRAQPAPPGSAAQIRNRRQAERHGACGGWLNPFAPQPGSTVADKFWRLAALRQPLLQAFAWTCERGFGLRWNHAGDPLSYIQVEYTRLGHFERGTRVYPGSVRAAEVRCGPWTSHVTPHCKAAVGALP